MKNTSLLHHYQVGLHIKFKVNNKPLSPYVVNLHLVNVCVSVIKNNYKYIKHNV